MNLWYRPSLAGMGLANLALLFCHGCWGSPRFDEHLARQRLAEIAPGVDSASQILNYAQSREGDRRTEYWVLLGKEASEPPVSDQRSRRNLEIRAAKFPSSALLSFAASVGVAEEVLGAPQRPDGQLWEWQADGSSVRLRTVETDEGFLSVVERLP